MLKGLGNLADMGKMLKAAQEMQTRMAAMQEELARITVEGSSGAGLVQASATAKGELTALSIDPSIFKADDKEVVEDLILAAIKDGNVPINEKTKPLLDIIAKYTNLPVEQVERQLRNCGVFRQAATA